MNKIDNSESQTKGCGLNNFNKVVLDLVQVIKFDGVVKSPIYRLFTRTSNLRS